MTSNIIIPQIPTPSIIDQLNAKNDNNNIDLTQSNDLPQEVIVIDTSSEEKEINDNNNNNNNKMTPKKATKKKKQRQSKQRQSQQQKKKKKSRCLALDYLSDSPKKKRGRKVKNKKNMPPIQKQPFFLVFPDLRLKCPQCDHIAICQGTLVQHLRTHRDSRICPVCSKIFSTQQNLIKHARLHSGERPYPCPIFSCKWAYKQKGDLLAHIQRGKHGTSSDNNRKPPKSKFYHGSTKLPTLHAISQQDINNSPDLKELIIGLRKREETKKAQKEKTKLKRKNQLDDFVLSMFLSIYDIENNELYKLIKVAKDKYEIKKKQPRSKPLSNITTTITPNITPNITPITTNIMDTLPKSRKANIKFKYLVNRVYGDYSIVLVPVGSVSSNEIYENTPEIVIDPKLIPALSNNNNDILNEINENPFKPNGKIKPPKLKKRKLLNNGNLNDRDLKDNNIVLAKNCKSSMLSKNGGMMGMIPKKRGYHKYNQTSDGYWQCDAPNCGSLFLIKEKLELHCKQLHDSGYYGCKYCQRIYRSQKNVQNHLKKSHQKHGDEYLNALIYNRFNRIIRMKQSKWNQIIKHRQKQGEIDDDKDKIIQKSILIKTHPINHTILRYEHESEIEGMSDNDQQNKVKKTKITDKLVPWTMQEKYIKSRRGRGRPRINKSKSSRKVKGKLVTRSKPKITTDSDDDIDDIDDDDIDIDSSDNNNDYYDSNDSLQSTKRRIKRKQKKMMRSLEITRSKKKKITKRKSKRKKQKENKSKNKRKRGRKKKSKKKESSISDESDDDETEEEEYEDSEEFSNYTENNDNGNESNDELIFRKYRIGTIYDDIDDNSSIDSMDICQDEKSILALDYKLDQYLRKKQSQNTKIRQSARKRKRFEMEQCDDNIIANIDPISDSCSYLNIV